MKGYNFGGQKAQLLKARLKFLRENPDAARQIANGIRPKGYPQTIRALETK